MSSTYPLIYGNLKTTLRPLSVWNYNTTVNIEFTGFASVIQGIFSKYMNANVLVKMVGKFYQIFGGEEVGFGLGENVQIPH